MIRELGAKADPLRDRITVDGRAASPGRLRYVAYHKPVGVVSTMSDPLARPSIGDVARRLGRHLFPVGRLDFESSGLVLLTNDGEMAQKLSHPRFEVPKVYRVKVRGLVDERALDHLRRGVHLEDGKTAPAEVAVERFLERKTRLVVVIHEGRQRQVRRMLEAVGYPVERLSRVGIGPVRLGALRPGEVRDLTEREILSLRGLVREDSASRGGVKRPRPRASALRGRAVASGRTRPLPSR